MLQRRTPELERNTILPAWKACSYSYTMRQQNHRTCKPKENSCTFRVTKTIYMMEANIRFSRTLFTGPAFLMRKGIHFTITSLGPNPVARLQPNWESPTS
jgi:hypothetical protein